MDGQYALMDMWITRKAKTVLNAPLRGVQHGGMLSHTLTRGLPLDPARVAPLTATSFYL